MLDSLRVLAAVLGIIALMASPLLIRAAVAATANSGGHAAASGSTGGTQTVAPAQSTNTSNAAVQTNTSNAATTGTTTTDGTTANTAAPAASNSATPGTIGITGYATPGTVGVTNIATPGSANSGTIQTVPSSNPVNPAVSNNTVGVTGTTGSTGTTTGTAGVVAGTGTFTTTGSTTTGSTVTPTNVSGAVNGSTAVTTGVNGMPANSIWMAQDQYWSTNYASRPYYNRQIAYTAYQPAYQYGVTSYNQFGGTPYSSLTAAQVQQLQSGWEQARGNSTLTWSQAQPAVEDAYNRLASNRNGVTPASATTSSTGAVSGNGTVRP